MAYVLDASALTAYFDKEPGYEKVKDLLATAASGGRRLLLSTINWGEVYYVAYRTYGSAQANQIAQIIESFPIEIVDVDVALAKQAALYKVTHKMPYVDSFAAALAKLHKGTLVTGDKEFKTIAHEVKIAWLI